MSGYNCTVFAYGATGAGKTHTMLGTRDNPGVIARTVENLYSRVDEARESNPGNLSLFVYWNLIDWLGTTFDVEVEYLEVYNEKINDLLVAFESEQPKSKVGKDLPLREVGGTVVISGLTKKRPADADDLMEMLATGNSRRTQHPTDANAQRCVVFLY